MKVMKLGREEDGEQNAKILARFFFLFFANARTLAGWMEGALHERWCG